MDILLSGGKGLMLNTRMSTPPEQIFARSALLELQAIGGIKERSFVLAMLLIQLKEYRQSHPIENRLHHAVIIDDAMYFRNIMGFAKTRIIDIDRSEKQVMFTTVLRELSSMGESVIVSIPLMGNTRPDFLHNFAVKIAHKLSPEFGSDIFRQPMGLSDGQYEESSSLKTGDALVAVKDWPAAQLIEVPEFISLSTIVPQSLTESDRDIRKVTAKNIDMDSFRPCAGCKWWQGGCDVAVYDLAREISLNPKFELAFAKYFLSFSVDLTQLVHMRSEIVHAVQSLGGSDLKNVGVADLTWCCLCQTTERYFDRVGNEHHINYAQLQDLKEYWLRVMAAAFIKETTDVPKKLDINDLRDWRDSLQQHEKRDQGPLPTCGACTSKCFYRVDIERILRDEKLHFDFSSSINSENKKKKTYQLVAFFCMLQCERLIGQRHLDIAYCLAVHFLKRFYISDDSQNILLMHTRKELEKLMTRPDLRLTPKQE